MNGNDLLDSANHEADLVWSRYNAMVVADTIFIAAIAAITQNTCLAFAGSCVGILLTAIWWILTSAGWALSHAMLNAAGENPTTSVRVYHDWCNRVWRDCYADPIWWLAHMVIGLFYFVYGGLTVYFAGQLFGSTCWAVITIGVPALLLLSGMLYLSLVKFSVGLRVPPNPPLRPPAAGR